MERSGRVPFRVSKRLLQAAVALCGLIPVLTGASGVLSGTASIAEGMVPPIDLDSHFRYLSGIFLGVGLAFYACIPAIERKGGLFRLLAALVVLGGIGRAISGFSVGWPAPAHLAGLGMELVGVPLLVLWQGWVAQRAVSAGRG